MEEIKVGEYVRNQEGFIFVADERWLCDYKQISSLYDQEYKHSPNIIDLIEAGDYVNGKYVYDVFETVNSGGKLVKVDCMRGYYKPEEIMEVVTKEQFESMKYHVGGKEE